METIGLLPLLSIWSGSIIFSAVVASAKGHTTAAWIAGAIFFGPIALIGAVGMPDHSAEKRAREEARREARREHARQKREAADATT